MFKEKYLKYKKKYLDLKIKELKKIKVGGYYIIDSEITGVEIFNYITEDDCEYIFYIAFDNGNYQYKYYREGPIVFIQDKEYNNLMTIKEFIDRSINRNNTINIAFREFLKYYGENFRNSQFYELFYPCVSRSDDYGSEDYDEDCLSMNDPIYFNLFDSTYKNTCEIDPMYRPFPIQVNQIDPSDYDIIPWNTIVNTMLIKKSEDWKMLDGGISLNDKYNTRACNIINEKKKTMLTYIKEYNQLGSKNNICHLPIYINSIPTPKNSIFPAGNTTGANWISICSEAYLYYIKNVNNNGIAYFRGNQIPWMHFKIKVKSEFTRHFGITQKDYFNIVIRPLLKKIKEDSDNNDEENSDNEYYYKNNYQDDNDEDNNDNNDNNSVFKTNSSGGSTYGLTGVNNLELEFSKKIENNNYSKYQPIIYKKDNIPINQDKMNNLKIENKGSEVIDVFEKYEIKSADFIDYIEKLCEKYNLKIEKRTPNQLFYRLEDDHLDKLTLKILFGIDNDEFLSNLISSYEKSFNVQTSTKYEKTNLIINELKSLELNLNDKFIIDIKNIVLNGRLTNNNFKVLKIRYGQNFSNEEKDKIFNLCNTFYNK